MPVEEDDENQEQEVEDTQTWAAEGHAIRKGHLKGKLFCIQRLKYSPKTIRHIAGCGLVNGPTTKI